MKLLNLLKKQALGASALLVLVLVTINTIIIYYNEYKLDKMTKIKVTTERAKHQTGQLWHQAVRNVDIGLRGYALTKDSALLVPFNDGLRDFPLIVGEVKTILQQQDFTNTFALDSIEYGVGNFIKACTEMAILARMDSMKAFTAAMKEDPGRDTWYIYSRNSEIINSFENSLSDQAISEYEAASKQSKIVQTLLFIIGCPTLLFMFFRIRKDQKSRVNLFLKLERNNREYLFDPGTKINVSNEDVVIDNSIRNFKHATDFIKEITSGNFTVHWQGINKENEELNKKNLVGELLTMRERLKAIKAEEESRRWVNEGLAKFSNVIQEHQHNYKNLTYEVLVFIVKYLKAQQGALFILKEDSENRRFLEMEACYAFDRKKHLNKRIEPGEGLVGQTFLEKQSTVYYKLPEGYTQIVSGLGEGTPHTVVIVPMKYNNKVEAVIELASFRKYTPLEIEFIEKLGEITASSLGSVKNTERMEILIRDFEAQTQLLKAQEEELRQNMEEMEATQEAMRRVERTI